MDSFAKAFTIKSSEICTRAAKHIAKVGLAQGEFFLDHEWSTMQQLCQVPREDVPCCMLGAIYRELAIMSNLTGLDTTFPLEIEDAILGVLSDNCGSEFTGRYEIPEWNDMKGRTKEEVCAVLEAAAARLTIIGL